LRRKERHRIERYGALRWNRKRIGPPVDNTDGKPLIEMRQRIPKDNRSGSAQNTFIDAMGIDPRSFWTQNELGATEVCIVLWDRDTLSVRDTRVILNGCDTCTSFFPIVMWLDVEVDLNITLLLLWVK
jgi:hypothetical protein